MVSLKLTAEEAKDSTLCCPSDPGDAPAYPYGTELRLDDGTLAKLGMTALPAVGTKFTVTAIAEVVSSHSNENQEGREQSMCLQITDMELATAGAGKSDAERAARIYGNDKE